MAKFSDGGPVFPQDGELKDLGQPPHVGLTKREYFAGLAMQTYLAYALQDEATRGAIDQRFVANRSFWMAEAMIVEMEHELLT